MNSWIERLHWWVFTHIIILGLLKIGNDLLRQSLRESLRDVEKDVVAELVKQSREKDD